MTEPLTTTGIKEGVSASLYHADRGSLSHSGAKLLLPPSAPAKFRYRMDNPPAPKRQFDFGHAAHKFVLGEGEEIVPVYADDWRTKDAKEQREAAHAEGKIPLLHTEVEHAINMAEVVASHPVASPIFTQGRAEMSMWAEDPDTGVLLRGRSDWLADNGDLGEYKTSVTANPAELQRLFWKYGYHMQAAWYRSLVISLGLSDNPRFRFVVQEKTPPYLVTVIEYDDEALVEGRRLNRAAIDLYAECVRTDSWPDYGTETHLLSLPLWALDQEMEF